MMKAGELISIARKVQSAAYAPYSEFQVGAALLCKNGKVFTGVNVENSSYGLTVCAERIAMFKAVSEGERDFQSIAITGSGDGYIYPCGACLQVLAEFGNELKVIVSNEENEFKEYKLSELLPQQFAL